MMRRILQVGLTLTLCGALGLVSAQEKVERKADGRPPQTGAARAVEQVDQQQVLRRWQELPLAQRKLLRQKLERWKQLSPEKQKRILENFGRFRKLPPQKQQAIRKRAEQFRELSPTKRQEMLNRYRVWMSLPERGRRLARRALLLLKELLAEDYGRLRKAPPGRRKMMTKAVRQKLIVLLALPPDKVKELKGLPPKERRDKIDKFLQKTKKDRPGTFPLPAKKKPSAPAKSSEL